MILVTIPDCYRCNIFKVRNDCLTFLDVVELPDISFGLGDTLGKILDQFGSHSCKKCKIRQSILNEIFPYFWKKINPKHLQIRNVLLKLNKKIYPVLLDNNLDKEISLTNIDPHFEIEVKKYEEMSGNSID